VGDSRASRMRSSSHFLSQLGRGRCSHRFGRQSLSQSSDDQARRRWWSRPDHRTHASVTTTEDEFPGSIGADRRARCVCDHGLCFSAAVTRLVHLRALTADFPFDGKVETEPASEAAVRLARRARCPDRKVALQFWSGAGGQRFARRPRFRESPAL